MNNYTIEKHAEGYCIVTPGGDTVGNGAPHMKSTLYFKKKAEAEAFRDLIDIDTFTEREGWGEEHQALWDSLPKVIQDAAGDMFEVKWYQGADYNGLMWEAEHNWFGKGKHLDEFKEAYDSLVNEQKNLIYYMYEA